jgi:hypothetical protein
MANAMYVGMKKILTIVLASVMFAGAASAAGTENIGKVARSKDVPGKFVPGQCKVFAIELAKRLNAAGADAKVIVYDWQSADSRGGAATGRHAVVVYQEGSRTYVMDNMTWSPKWVKTGSGQTIAQTFSGQGVYVASAQEMNTSDGSMLAAK